MSLLLLLLIVIVIIACAIVRIIAQIAHHVQRIFCDKCTKRYHANISIVKMLRFVILRFFADQKKKAGAAFVRPETHTFLTSLFTAAADLLNLLQPQTMINQMHQNLIHDVMSENEFISLEFTILRAILAMEILFSLRKIGRNSNQNPVIERRHFSLKTSKRQTLLYNRCIYKQLYERI